jgi:hypothetical protein
MDFLRRSACVSRMDKARNIKVTEIMKVEDKPDVMDTAA